MGARGDHPSLTSLLDRHRQDLLGYLERRASGLLRYESAEDLAQGVHVRALRGADRFVYQGKAAFLAWLFAIARRHVGDRNDYWKALKRNAGPMLRITYGAGATRASSPGVQVPISMTGPSTFAERRELLDVATRALGNLPERDAQLVRMMTTGATIEDVAETLGISTAAAQRARLRAVERFRKAVEVARRQAGPDRL